MTRGRHWWRVTLWALHAVGQGRGAWAVGAVVVALVGATGAAREFNFGEAEPRLLLDVGRGVLGLGGTLLALMLPVQLFSEGVQQRSVTLLFARGVGRGTWLVALWTAAGVVLGWLVLLGGGALAVVLIAAGHAVAGPAYVAALAALLAQLLVVAAAGLLAAVVCRGPVLALLLGVGYAGAAHLAPVLAFAAGRSAGWARAAWSLLGWIVPDFSALAARGGVGLVGAAGYATLALLAAGLVFSRREL